MFLRNLIIMNAIILSRFIDLWDISLVKGHIYTCDKVFICGGDTDK